MNTVTPDVPDASWLMPRVRAWVNDRFRRGLHAECPICDQELDEELDESDDTPISYGDYVRQLIAEELTREGESE